MPLLAIIITAVIIVVLRIIVGIIINIINHHSSSYFVELRSHFLFFIFSVLYRSRIHPWAVCGDVSDEILLELYNTIVIVIYSSYLSQQPGDSYYPGLVDGNDEHDHNGLLSKEILKKNMISSNSLKELKELEQLLLSDNGTLKSLKSNKDKTENKELKSIWNSKEANSKNFKFQVYAQRVCPLGNIIQKVEGPHKRSIHWVKSVQTKCTPKEDNSVSTSSMSDEMKRSVLVNSAIAISTSIHNNPNSDIDIVDYSDIDNLVFTLPLPTTQSSSIPVKKTRKTKKKIEQLPE